MEDLSSRHQRIQYPERRVFVVCLYVVTKRYTAGQTMQILWSASACLWQGRCWVAAVKLAETSCIPGDLELFATSATACFILVTLEITEDAIGGCNDIAFTALGRRSMLGDIRSV